MAAICAACGKGTTFGRNIRHKHSGRWQRKAPATNRIFRPNLHSVTLRFEGQVVRARLCTRCIRTQTKYA